MWQRGAPVKDRPTVVLAVIAAVVVALAVLAGAVITFRGDPDFDTSTPEGVVQAYVKAIFDGDDTAALTYLDPRLGCDTIPDSYVSETARVTVTSTRATGWSATVEVSIVEGVYFDGGWSHTETFELSNISDGWVISESTWPFNSCTRGY